MISTVVFPCNGLRQIKSFISVQMYSPVHTHSMNNDHVVNNVHMLMNYWLGYDYEFCLDNYIVAYGVAH